MEIFHVLDVSVDPFLEDRRKMRAYNRGYALWLYSRLGDNGEPEPPLLASGKVYRIPERVERTAAQKADQALNPIGDGPDLDGYYAVTEPDYHAVGELVMLSGGRGVYCKMESPVLTGGFVKKWVKIT